MSFGLDPINSPEGRESHSLTAHQPLAETRPTEAKAEIPSSAVFARPDFLDVTATSVVNEEAILRGLQTSVNTLLERLQKAQPAEKFHEGAGKLAIDDIQTAVSAFVTEGTDFPTALATMKAWAAPYVELASPDEQRGLDERIRLVDQKTLLSVIQRLERIHAALLIEDPREQRVHIIDTFGIGMRSPTKLSSEVLLQAALLQTSADLARRTLDISELLKSLSIKELRPHAASALAYFGKETDPRQGELPYSSPGKLARARHIAVETLGGQALDAMKQDLKGDDYKFDFFDCFSGLLFFGPQAVPYMHECLKYGNPTTQMLTTFPGPKPESVDRVIYLTRLALLLTTELYTRFDIGPSLYLEPASTGPAQHSGRRAPPENDIVHDALLLSRHPSSESIQIAAMKLLKAAAFERVLTASVHDISGFISDPDPTYVRKHDPRVLRKFQSLTTQLADHAPEIRQCVLSMNFIDQVLVFAANETGSVKTQVQLDALTDLKTKLEQLQARMSIVADASAILSIFEQVGRKLTEAPVSTHPQVSEKQLDILRFIDTHRSAQ